MSIIDEYVACYVPKSADLPPDLAHVVDAWEGLPDHVKLAIQALVKAASTEGA